MQRGTVKWYSEEKGYGFIRGDDGNEVFVHHTGILGEGYRMLQEEDIVEYDTVEGPRGLQAREVRKVENIERSL